MRRDKSGRTYPSRPGGCGGPAVGATMAERLSSLIGLAPTSAPWCRPDPTQLREVRVEELYEFSKGGLFYVPPHELPFIRGACCL